MNRNPRPQPPETARTALYGHLWGCTGHVRANPEGAAP